MREPKRNVLKNIIYHLKLYFFYLKLYFRTLVEYRADTVITLFTGLLIQAGSLAFIAIIFSRIPKIAGWSFYELVFIYAFSVTGKALSEVFLNASFTLNGFIRRGMLDIFLTRPVGPLFQAIGISQEMNGMGMAATGMIIMSYAGSHLSIDWSMGKIFFTALAVICSMLIYFSVLMFLQVITFWILEIRNLIYPIAWMFDFTRYPLEIFHPVIRFLLVFIIPYAMASFYPAACILRGGEYSWAFWGVPLFTAAILFFMYRFWLIGLKRYSSVAG
jgi:ABC-2 type transport system permease protein